MQEFIITIVNNFGYIGIFFLIAIENLFPPIPSEVILTFSGFITTFTNLNLIGVIISSTIGSLIGAVILYGIGRLISKDRLKKLLNCKIVRALKFKKSEIKATEGYFDKIGITAVFFCRFIPIVRSLISIPAGIEKMNFNIFLILTTFGSLIWNTVIIIIGRLVGGSWQTISNRIGEYSNLVFLIFILVVIIFYFFIKLFKKIKIK